MYRTTFFLFGLLLSVSQVSSTFLRVGRRDTFRMDGLQVRQASGDDAACTSICTPFENSLNTCTTATCFCTSTVANSLQSCINCAVAASSTADVIESAQNLTSVYQTTCAGTNVPVVTIPAPVPAGPTVSGSGSAGTATGGSVTAPGKTVTAPANTASGTAPANTGSATDGLGLTSATAGAPAPTTSGDPATDLLPNITQVTIRPTSTAPGSTPGNTLGGASSASKIGITNAMILSIGFAVVLGLL